jgi:ATP-dependent 26S proteasome regulatory subunit
MKTFSEQIDTYIRGAFPLIYIYSNEYDRVLSDLFNYVDSFNLSVAPTISTISVLGRGLSIYIYNSGYGLSINGNYISGTMELEETLKYILDNNIVGIFVINNLHLIWENHFAKYRIYDLLYDIYQSGKVNHQHIIGIGTGDLPPEIQHYFVTIDYKLPTQNEIKEEVITFLTNYNVKATKKEVDAISSICSGMTIAEIQGSLSIALVNEESGIDLEILKQEKAKMVRKSGLLEWIRDTETINEVGGLEHLKEWFTRVAFVYKNLSKAIKFGLKVPKGCLITGVPGTGKTLSAKAIATLFEVPLFRLDVGRLFSSLVGETEKNTRELFKLIEAVSPAVILIDEIEKAFAGLESSSSSDSGVTARLIGSFLYFMQEKKAPSFFVCTSNDITKLPPEMLRKGRFDEIWYVGLPNAAERSSIWKIHLRKTGRNPDKYKVDDFVSLTEGFTGSEIEAVIQEALCNCFYSQKDLDNSELIKVINKTTPLSKLEAPKIKALEEWANKFRVRRANKQDVIPQQKRAIIKGS